MEEAQGTLSFWETLAVQRYEKAVIPKVIYPSGTQGRCHHPSENGRKTNAIKKKVILTDVVHPRTVLTFLPPLLLRLCLRSSLVAVLSSPCQIPHCQALRSRQTHVRICPDAHRPPGRNIIRSVKPACRVHHFLAVDLTLVRRWSADATVVAPAQ